MRCLPLVLALTLALPVQAQEVTPPEKGVEEGFDLMEEGGKLILRHLFEEMEPAMRDMDQAMEELGPMMAQLLAMIGEVKNYHGPEMLPNGDIIIRRKLPGEVEGEAAPKGGAEL